MKNILVMENKNAEELALNEIYYLSDGSLRDGLNYLEQLSVISQETITLEKTSDLFSVATKNEKLNLINEMINCRSKKLIAFFERTMSKGFFAHVYETTNRTNITYQYLLIAILK
jgi:DNA polymerase-3 subunit gamma/tau